MSALSRIPCCVPFCARSTAAARLDAKGHDEWLCRDHWRLVGRRTKVLVRGYGRRIDRGTADAMDRMLLGKWWQQAKAEAIEAAGGIG